jgi:hypothetical protein
LQRTLAEQLKNDAVILSERSESKDLQLHFAGGIFASGPDQEPQTLPEYLGQPTTFMPACRK